MPIRIRLFCRNIRRRIETGEEIYLIPDSTGLRFGKGSHWYETKYKKSCNNKPWKKLHISMYTAMNIHEAMITNRDIADKEVVDELIPDNLNISSFIADGGYYSSQKVEQLYQAGIMPVIPPPRSALGDLKTLQVGIIRLFNI